MTNRFQLCLNSDLFRSINIPVRDIGHLKVSGSKPKPGKSSGQVFRSLETFAHRRLRPSDGQIFGPTFIPLHHLGFYNLAIQALMTNVAF